MIVAPRLVRRREGRVERRAQSRGQFQGLDPGERLVQERLHLLLRLIDQFAQRGALFLWNRAHLLHDSRQFAIGSDIAGLGGLEVGPGGESGEFGRGLLDDRTELVLHGEG